MTREEYIKYRGEHSIPSELFYNYWLELKPSGYSNINLEEFKSNFEQFLVRTNGNMIVIGGKPKVIELGKIYYKVCKYFNEKFNL